MTQQMGLDVERAEEFVGRVFNGALGAIDVFTVYIGDRLGLYAALAATNALTPPGSRLRRTSTRATHASGSNSRRRPDSSKWTT